MGNRLIFLYQHEAFERWGDGVRKVISLLDMAVQACGVAVVKCAAWYLGSDDERTLARSDWSDFQEKPLVSRRVVRTVNRHR